MQQSIVIQNILLDNNLTQLELATKLGVSKQLISQICNGKRNVSPELRRKIQNMFTDVTFEDKETVSKEWLVSVRHSLGLTQKEFASRLQISLVLYRKLEQGTRNITKTVLQRIKSLDDTPKDTSAKRIYWCPDVTIPTAKHINAIDTIVIDERFLKYNDYVFNANSCFVVTLQTNALFPTFSIGDRVIIDTSYKNLIDGLPGMFEYGNKCYIRMIEKLPDRIKCASTENDGDTFYLPNTKGANVLGVIVPNIRL